MQKIQQQMQAKLEQTGLPYREIRCYGNQIVVISQSEDTANRWASLLAKFATVRGIVQTLDDRKTPVEYRGSTAAMKYVPVWRTFAAL